MRKTLLAAALAAILLLPALATVHAAGPGEVRNESLLLKDTLKGGPNDVLLLINNIIDIIFTLVLILTVIMVLYTAYLYLTSAGDEEKVRTAHKMLVWILVGVAVALLSAGVHSLIESAVLPDDATPTFPLTPPPGGNSDFPFGPPAA